MSLDPEHIADLLHLENNRKWRKGNTNETYIEGTRICAKCRERKDVSEFRFIRKARSTNKDIYNFYCFPCERSKKYEDLYGISLEEYEEMVALQGGRCLICGQIPSGKRALLFVDHDHDTGDIRGLLCSSCNRQLAWYEEFRETVNAYLDTVGKMLGGR